MAESPPRVLVVDDQLLVRKALRRHLVAANCEVRMEKDGRAGLDAVLSWKPHVVILDRRLPKLNGDDLARCIVEQAEKVPALFLITGEPTHSLAPVPGVVRLFSKPVSFEELYAAMKPYLDEAWKDDGSE